MTVGDNVRTLPSVKPRHWADRAGFVASLNRVDGEVGVSFVKVHDREKAEAWFLPGELTRLEAAHNPVDRPGAIQAGGESTRTRKMAKAT